jgi:hypothetical protein
MGIWEGPNFKARMHTSDRMKCTWREIEVVFDRPKEGQAKGTFIIGF